MNSRVTHEPLTSSAGDFETHDAKLAGGKSIPAPGPFSQEPKCADQTHGTRATASAPMEVMAMVLTPDGVLMPYKVTVPSKTAIGDLWGVTGDALLEQFEIHFAQFQSVNLINPVLKRETLLSRLTSRLSIRGRA